MPDCTVNYNYYNITTDASLDKMITNLIRKLKRKGEPIQIFSLDENDKLVLNRDKLAKILSSKHVKNKKVCVISIAGAFRQGKSFILNFLLRYLDLQYKKKQIQTHWLDGQDVRVKGFDWKAGSTRHTTGIWIWSEVYTATISSGEEVAIILMDTQGSFDNSSTITECASIFALSTLISSVQIYNLQGNIKSSDLSHLQIFSEYGKLAHANAQDLTEKPFQNLLFLVRDWQSPFEKEYGIEGGKLLLDEVLNIGTPKTEINNMRNKIKQLFDKVSCFLLPYPGRVVASSQDFNGNLNDIDPEFLKHVESLAPEILSPTNICVKYVNQRAIHATTFLEMVDTYWKCFSSGSMPSLQLLSEATAEIHHSVALKECKALYQSKMILVEKANKSDLKKHHEINKNEAIKLFRDKKKIGDITLTEKYLKQLDTEIEENFKTIYDKLDGASIWKLFGHITSASSLIGATLGSISVVVESYSVGMIAAGAGYGLIAGAIGGIYICAGIGVLQVGWAVGKYGYSYLKAKRSKESSKEHNGCSEHIEDVCSTQTESSTMVDPNSVPTQNTVTVNNIVLTITFFLLLIAIFLHYFILEA